jgi:hypothetical protein
MSLIPSESLNFPDSFRANVGWHIAEQGDQSNPPPSPPPPAVSLVDKPPAPPKTAPQPPTSKRPAEAEKITPSQITDSPSPAKPVAQPTMTETDTTVSPDEHQVAAEASTPSETAAGATGATLTGNDAAAFLSKMFFAAAAPAAVESANGQAGLTAPQLSTTSPVEEESAASLQAPAAGAGSTDIDSPAKPNRAAMPENAAPRSPQPHVIHHPEQKPANNGTRTTNSENGAATSTAVNPAEVEQPAQAQHLFQLLAAAVQRGAVSGTLDSPGAAEPVSRAPLRDPDGDISIPQEAPTLEPAARAAAPSAITHAAPAPSSPVVGPRAPAKIRIQPRKIKPRPQVATSAPPAAQPEPPSAPSEPVKYDEAVPAPVVEKAPIRMRPTVETKAAPANFEEPMRRLDSRELAAATRNLPSGRVDLTYSESRSRWIGFALSELAALTSVVLLGGYGFTHKFPDPTLKILVFILMFAAAAIAFALPIAFIRNNPNRWQKRALDYRRD